MRCRECRGTEWSMPGKLCTPCSDIPRVVEKHGGTGRRCNCENGKCEDLGRHRAGACANDPAKGAPLGTPRALYVGEVCLACVGRLSREFVLLPYGTAKR